MHQIGPAPQPTRKGFLTSTLFALVQKDDVFKAVPTPLSPPPAPATPVTPSTPATPATPASSVSSGTPSTPNSISPSGIVKRKTGKSVSMCMFPNV